MCIKHPFDLFGDLVTLSQQVDLVAINGQVVATSESYQQKASALSTIASIQKNASGAPVDDQTDA